MNELLDLLSEVPDPEIPVINIVELGIVREVKDCGNNTCEVTITPTYSGCPAMFVMEGDIRKKLRSNGWETKVITKMSPIWTTDWMTDEAREKLRQYGIAPPEKNGNENFIGVSKTCPHCGSKNTEQISRFGSTLCKATYQCLDCLEPFEYFKCH